MKTVLANFLAHLYVFFFFNHLTCWNQVPKKNKRARKNPVRQACKDPHSRWGRAVPTEIWSSQLRFARTEGRRRRKNFSIFCYRGLGRWGTTQNLANICRKTSNLNQHAILGNFPARTVLGRLLQVDGVFCSRAENPHKKSPGKVKIPRGNWHPISVAFCHCFIQFMMDEQSQ